MFSIDNENIYHFSNLFTQRIVCIVFILRNKGEINSPLPSPYITA